MPEPFKHRFDAATVRSAAGHLSRVWPAFDGDRFVAQATAGLDALELKARVLHITRALRETLPEPFEAAADVLEHALAPAEPEDNASGAATSEDGLSGWVLWSAGEFVAQHGLAHPDRSLRALHAITQRFTAEFAIRPFLVAHPALTLRTLADWVHDPSAHVRRLVSEGSRPRLPWGVQLKAFIADPSATLPLLRALQDDPSAYVRRSVANHLNDIARDHPAIVAEWLETHLPAASDERRALLRHASRTLIKRGDRRVMHAWGLGAEFEGEVSLAIAPSVVLLGEHVELTLTLRARGRDAQRVAIDYVVHHVRADGSTSPKVFKGWTTTLRPGEGRTLTRRHALRPISTRRYYPGVHRVEVQVNGRVRCEGEFRLR
jgi:3-methyladenine DNA glycosylase AlkC